MADTALRRLIGRGSIYTTGSFLEAGAALLVLPSITRLLAPEEFGAAATALVVAQITIYLASFGAPSAVARLYFDGPEGPEKARVLALWALFGAVIVAGVLDLTGEFWAPVVTGADYTEPLRIAVWMAVPGALLLAAMASFAAQDRPAPFVAISLTNAAGGQAIGLLLVATVDATATAYLAGLAVGRTAAGIAGLSLLGVRPRWLRRLDVVRHALALGLPTVVHSIAMYLLLAGTRLIIQQVDGLTAVARYQIAYAVGSIGIIVLTATNQAWAPLIFRASDEDRWETLATTRRALWRLSAILAGLLALASPLALVILAPASYDRPGLVPVCGILALAALPMTAYLAAHIVLFQERRTGALAFAAPVATAVNLGACAFLVPPFGLVGAALSTVLAVGVLATIVQAAARRAASVSWDQAAAVRASLLAVALVSAGIVLPTEGVEAGIRALAAIGVVALLVVELRQLLDSP